MEQTWFVSEDEGLVSESRPDGGVRLFREGWEHDCLDVDFTSETVTHRRQGSDKTGDPKHWETSVRQLRHNADEWQVLILREDLARWIEAQKQTVQNRIRFAQDYPAFDIAHDVKAAKRVLDRLIQLEPGWVSLAPEVSSEIGRHS